MLEIKDLTIAFHRHLVLHDLQFQLQDNELVYIHGINGSGKSTLFKIICEILKPMSGQMIKDPHLQIGALIENPGFLENETLEFNLKFLASLKNHYDPVQVELLCQRFQLEYYSRMKMKHFSLGMRQKAGIIQAIMENQKLILLDEPTRGLDQQSVDTFCELINELHQQGHTIIIAAHDYLKDIHYTKIYHLTRGKLQVDEMA